MKQSKEVQAQVRQIYAECRDIEKTAETSGLTQDDVRLVLKNVSYKQILDDSKRVKILRDDIGNVIGKQRI